MRILLAEDELSLSRVLVKIFNKNNYSVDAVYNGVDALTYLESGIYDVLILDVMMPKMDGIEALKRLRERGDKIPVLLLTAKSEVEDKLLGFENGADDYLTKPFEMRELIARIKAITRRGGQAITDSLSLGNLTLDRDSYELVVGENKSKLSGKEFQVMEMLMLNVGKIISVDRFMEKVWGYDSETESSVVWVYVSNLRKKLIALGSNVNIVAKRNVGYYVEIGNVGYYVEIGKDGEADD